MNRLIMKSLSVILLLASGVSCQKQEAMDDGGGTRGFVIRASLEEGAADTRTSMSPNEDETSYAVFWNETDCISVNGIASESISIQEDRRSAEFTFLKGFESALYAAYPASVVSKYESGALTLLLPNVQTWSESDQFDPAAAVMLAQAADGASLRFRHAMAYLRVTLSEASDPEPIAAVVLSANDGSALCGAFQATYGSDLWTLTPQESAAAQVELRCGTQGAPLGSRMVIAIPAGEYAAGLTVQVKDVSGDYQVRKSVNAFTATAGRIYDMSFAFEPEGGTSSNDIFSVSDWELFAEKIAAGETFEGQTVNLMADLTVPEYFAYANGTFEGTFEGNGKTMTAGANVWPLFATVGEKGVVRNLNFDGAFTTMANPASAGNAVIAKVNLGVIRDCTNSADTEVTVSGSLIFGTLVAQNGGTLERCINYGNVTVTQTASASSGFYGGGLAAIGHTVLGTATATQLDVDETCRAGNFVDCENHGNLTIQCAGAAPIRSGFGGICGIVYMNGVRFTGCENYGDVIRTDDADKAASNNGSATVGGILGRSAAWFTTAAGDSRALDVEVNGFDTRYENCVNEGTVQVSCRHSGGIMPNSSGARLDAAGGIVGAAIGVGDQLQRIVSCHNKGAVVGGWTTAVNTTALGGLVGLATGTEITGSTSSGDVRSVDATYYIGAAGGAVGFARRDVTLAGDCLIQSRIEAWTPSGKSLLPGLLFGNVVTAATASDTQVAGEISEDGVSAGVGADNFSGFLADPASNVQPTTSNIVWYEE